MKTITLKSVAVAALMAIVPAMNAATPELADKKIGMIIGYDNVESIENANERYPVSFFQRECPEGVIITPNDIDKIDASKLECIWIHIDRIGINAGYRNLPEAFISDGMLNALKQFVADGGNLLLTKHATQLVAPIGRVADAFSPNIFGAGEGGEGTDVWTIQAQIGLDNKENDPSQFYDRSTHAIYAGLDVYPAKSDANPNGFDSDTFPMEGTGDGSPMWRQDHNCCWDLNGFAYTADGQNTVEKFQNETASVVLGTWGHVKDYAVAGIVEFLPTETAQGTIIANGLAACEWWPNYGTNAYHSNLEKLTVNCLNYLAPTKTGAVCIPVLERGDVALRGVAGGVEYTNVNVPSSISLYTADGRMVARSNVEGNGTIHVGVSGIVVAKVESTLGTAVSKVVVK